jgi:hypothetical protein
MVESEERLLLREGFFVSLFSLPINPELKGDWLVTTLILKENK